MKIATSLLLVTMYASLSACNTLQGVGQDVQSGGKAISNAAEKTEEKIKSY